MRGAFGKSFSARNESSAFIFAGLRVAENAVVLGFCYLRALEGGFGEGVAHYGGFCYLFLESGQERVVDGLLYEDSGGGATDLALVGHDACDRLEKT